MTTTYELYTNENGTPKAVEGKAPAIIERVETLEETLDKGVVTSVNGKTGAVTVDVGVTSFNGSKGAVTYSAPVSSVNGKTGAVTVDVGVTSVNGKTGAVTISVPPTSKAYVTETWSNGTNWYRKWSDGWIEQGGNATVSIGVGGYSSESTTITLPTAFSGTKYYVGSVDDHEHISTSVATRKTSTMVLKLTAHASNWYTAELIVWYACGY